MPSNPLTKLASWLIYKGFIFLSKRVSFVDFTRIWNEAYSAYVEAEWMKLKKQSLSIRYMQGELEVSPAPKLKGLPSGLTWLKPGPRDGRDVN